MTLRRLPVSEAISDAETRALLNSADLCRLANEDMRLAAGQIGEARLHSLSRAQARLGLANARFTEAVALILADRIGEASGPESHTRAMLEASLAKEGIAG